MREVFGTIQSLRALFTRRDASGRRIRYCSLDDPPSNVATLVVGSRSDVQPDDDGPRFPKNAFSSSTYGGFDTSSGTAFQDTPRWSVESTDRRVSDIVSVSSNSLSDGGALPDDRAMAPTFSLPIQQPQHIGSGDQSSRSGQAVSFAPFQDRIQQAALQAGATRSSRRDRLSFDRAIPAESRLEGASQLFEPASGRALLFASGTLSQETGQRPTHATIARKRPRSSSLSAEEKVEAAPHSSSGSSKRRRRRRRRRVGLNVSLFRNPTLTQPRRFMIKEEEEEERVILVYDTTQHEINQTLGYIRSASGETFEWYVATTSDNDCVNVTIKPWNVFRVVAFIFGAPTVPIWCSLVSSFQENACSARQLWLWVQRQLWRVPCAPECIPTAQIARIAPAFLSDLALALDDENHITFCDRLLKERSSPPETRKILQLIALFFYPYGYATKTESLVARALATEVYSFLKHNPVLRKLYPSLSRALHALNTTTGQWVSFGTNSKRKTHPIQELIEFLYHPAVYLPTRRTDALLLIKPGLGSRKMPFDQKQRFRRSITAIKRAPRNFLETLCYAVDASRAFKDGKEAPTHWPIWDDGKHLYFGNEHILVHRCL